MSARAWLALSPPGAAMCSKRGAGRVAYAVRAMAGTGACVGVHPFLAQRANAVAAGNERNRFRGAATTVTRIGDP